MKHHQPSVFSTPLATAATSPARLPVVDVLRGIAVVLMVIYHFCYDLMLFRLVMFDFYQHLFWLNFRNIIVTLFLFTVGISLHLAHADCLHWRAWARRFGILCLCAALISLVTWVQFGERFIFFGILHFIGLASLIALPVRHGRWWVAICGILLLVIGNNVQHPLFNQIWLQWVGLMTHKPYTEDYVPLLPWFGIVLMGLVAGRQLRPHTILHGHSPHTLIQRVLSFSGRHSLWVYLLHQPFLMGILWAGISMI